MSRWGCFITLFMLYYTRCSLFHSVTVYFYFLLSISNRGGHSVHRLESRVRTPHLLACGFLKCPRAVKSGGHCPPMIGQYFYQLLYYFLPKCSTDQAGGHGGQSDPAASKKIDTLIFEKRSCPLIRPLSSLWVEPVR